LVDWRALRSEFPVTQHYNFQNNAAVAPLCARAVQAIQRLVDLQQRSAYLEGRHYQEAERVRQLGAALINANPDEVCFVKNTSEGLNFVANGLSWQRGDNVITTSVEFPANVFCWQGLRSQGVSVQIVMEEDGRIPLEGIIEAINARTRVVTISSVQYISGFRADLAALGAYCEKKGVLLCVDGIQSLGAFPIDVKAMKIDFLSADAHKWLCGPEGIGLFYVKKEVQGLLRPTCVGYLSMKSGLDFDRARFELHDSAKRYDSGAYNLLGIHALGGALDLIHEIGVEAIAARLLHLTDMLVEGVRAKGYHVFSPRARTEASGIVTFHSDVHEARRIQPHLQAEHRVVIAVRGGRLRASPHMYTSEDEIRQLVDLLPGH
jgi:selenocysteine lyase/cysteine desulfurase